MAPRAYWKGYLKLSLVSCPIALYPASSSSERVSFNRINTKTGNRLKQQMVDAETGQPVEKEDIGRGYEYAKGQYLIVEDDELAKIKIESTHTIEIDRFVTFGDGAFKRSDQREFVSQQTARFPIPGIVAFPHLQLVHLLIPFAGDTPVITGRYEVFFALTDPVAEIVSGR